MASTVSFIKNLATARCMLWNIDGLIRSTGTVASFGSVTAAAMAGSISGKILRLFSRFCATMTTLMADKI